MDDELFLYEAPLLSVFEKRGRCSQSYIQGKLSPNNYEHGFKPFHCVDPLLIGCWVR